jgi:hypothetical protein
MRGGLKLAIRLVSSIACGSVGFVAGGFLGLVVASAMKGGAGLHGLDPLALILLLVGVVTGAVVGSTLGWRFATWLTRNPK